MTDSVLKDIVGRSGRLTLNRPKALNSLDLPMCQRIHEALDEWRDDDAVEQVVIVSEHPKAFCAGGDVRQVREAQMAGNSADGDAFFTEEYDMNAAIAEFPKPYVAVIDGIAMGGGLGVSLHGSHRVVTERASAAMPEMAIGFVPDVGISHFSQHVATAAGEAEPAIARFLGLTGYRLDAADLLWAGWATHFVPQESLDDFLRAVDADGIDAALGEFARDPKEAGESKLAAFAPCARQIFGFDTWREIDNALEGGTCSGEERRVITDLLRSASPTSLVAGTELYAANAGEGVDLRTALRNEYAIGRILRHEPNFIEGVRAVLVDKDRNADWQPKSTGEVDATPYRDAVEK
ncbi:enoyl-CoA hydratase/isomerase family protein [uncultured Corynebacterium sp.]|uniref:enoyl-CoA hydratase/isomerase family protein n=1 Tax=uncultured Corynebacterium sp. TaxID=159447 RepID=UPI0025F0655C|nr:enoyl-CoA hydratase/isomerase family protein [uncultured Corynebacterium sp.]